MNAVAARVRAFAPVLGFILAVPAVSIAVGVVLPASATPALLGATPGALRMSAPFQHAAEQHAAEWQSMPALLAVLPLASWRIAGGPQTARTAIVAPTRDSGRVDALARARRG